MSDSIDTLNSKSFIRNQISYYIQPPWRRSCELFLLSEKNVNIRFFHILNIKPKFLIGKGPNGRLKALSPWFSFRSFFRSFRKMNKLPRLSVALRSALQPLRRKAHSGNAAKEVTEGSNTGFLSKYWDDQPAL